MTLDLPRPIAAYFTADTGDSEAVAETFTESAVVQDEGHTHQGRAAIKQWRADVSAKYQFTIEPLAGEQADDKFVVTARVTGNFPGSPVVLRFFFGLEGDMIASLEVIP
jgi:hypothetical protein